MLHRLIEIFISAFIMLPIFGLLNKVRFHNFSKTIRYFIFAVYLSAVYLFVGLPTVQFIRLDLSLTLIPFIPMLADFKNTILNIMLFIPAGIMLPFLWAEYQTWKATVKFGFVMSLTIELLQSLTYRATDINDVIANTLGAAVGYGIFSILKYFFPSATRYAENRKELFVVIFPVILIMFFVQPCFANLYYKMT